MVCTECVGEWAIGDCGAVGVVSGGGVGGEVVVSGLVSC